MSNRSLLMNGAPSESRLRKAMPHFMRTSRTREQSREPHTTKSAGSHNQDQGPKSSHNESGSKKHQSSRKMSMSDPPEKPSRHDTGSSVDIPRSERARHEFENTWTELSTAKSSNKPTPPTPPPEPVTDGTPPDDALQAVQATGTESESVYPTTRNLSAHPQQTPALTSNIRTLSSDAIVKHPLEPLEIETLRQDLEAARDKQKALELECHKAKVQAKATRDQFEHDKTQLEAKNKDLDGQLSTAKARLGAKTTSCNEMERANKEQERVLFEKNLRVRALETELHDLQSFRDNQASKVLQLERDIQGQWLSLEAANAEIGRLKSELTSELDDAWFKRKWTELGRDVEGLSNRLFNGQLGQPRSAVLTRSRGGVLEKSNFSVSQRLGALSREYYQYLNSTTHRSLLIQAFLWHVLVTEVFNHEHIVSGDGYIRGLFWAGAERNELACVKQELHPISTRDRARDNPKEAEISESKLKQFHRWRTMTSILLLTRRSVKKRRDEISNHVLTLVNSTVNTILPYVVCSEAHRMEAHTSLRDELLKIINLAIEIDAEIYKQHGWIHCSQWTASDIDGRPFYGMLWNDEHMQMVTGPGQGRTRYKMQSPCVELIIQPALYKMGGQYGEDYNQREILCKARAVACEDKYSKH